MKKIKMLLSIAMLVGIIVVACKKSEFISNDKKSNDLLKTSKYLTGPNGELVSIDPNKPLELQTMELFAGYEFSSVQLPNNEYDASVLVAPLMTNSRQYFYDAGLSSFDLIDEFSSLNNYQIAYVAFQLRAIDAEGGWSIPGCNSDSKVIKCIVQSLIPCTIMDFFQGEARDLLISGGFRAGFNALSYGAKKSVVKVLATRAGQMFGGGGLALTFFVYDFSLCMLTGSEATDPNNKPDIPEGSMLRNDLVDDNAQMMFPLNYNDNVFFTKYYTHLGNYLGTSGSNIAKPLTHIYYNSSDSRYYKDALFTKILPDGFYILTEDMNISNSSQKYREVVDGKVVLVATVIDLDLYRALETFDPATHLAFFQ
ncbi:hypothetical protein [Pedobacter nototheniae]|uniref:hypothetical protein n=1 Tax=Pedobacter nototheniae TaxID=2488994 RepID=UPI00292D7F67|nr:hypothetical protein [Pedobacter nototheniae]